MTAKTGKLLAAIFIALLVLLVVVLLTRTALNNSSSGTASLPDKVEISDSAGRRATVGRDGFVRFVDEDGNESSIAWSSDKISSFFDYIELNFGGQADGLPGDDELIKAVLDELSGGGSEGVGSGTGGDLSDFFSSPTPPGGGSGGSGGSDGGGGSGGGGTPPPPAPKWCKHWKLSYCADTTTPSASPTPLVSFPPGVIQAQDCSDWNSQVQTKTVISNFSCSQEAQ